MVIGAPAERMAVQSPFGGASKLPPKPPWSRGDFALPLNPHRARSLRAPDNPDQVFAPGDEQRGDVGSPFMDYPSTNRAPIGCAQPHLLVEYELGVLSNGLYVRKYAVQ
jgi:hypothetical protein